MCNKADSVVASKLVKVLDLQNKTMNRLSEENADLRDRLADIADVLKDYRGLPGSPAHYAYHVASGACDDEA